MDGSSRLGTVTDREFKSRPTRAECEQLRVLSVTASSNYVLRSGKQALTILGTNS